MTGIADIEALRLAASCVPEPLDRARALLAAQDAYSAEAERLTFAALAEARASGATWEDIGRAFGVTRQAAQQRWGNAPGSKGG